MIKSALHPPYPARGRRRLFGATLALLLLAAIEATSYALIALAPDRLHAEARSSRLEQWRISAEHFFADRPDAIARFDPVLGWWPNAGLENARTRINSTGQRSAREYSAFPEPGILRIAVFGDSFVYGHEVKLRESWPALLESRASDREVLNYGVTGYGPDQAYLRFAREAPDMHPHVVIWAISPWILDRTVNVYVPFLTHGSEFAVKPRFLIDENDELALLPLPVSRKSDAIYSLESPGALRELGAHDQFYDALVFENPLHDWSATIRLATALWTHVNRRYLDPCRTLTGPPGEGVFNAESEAFRIVVKLMERLEGESRSVGAVAVVMMMPDQHALTRRRMGKSAIDAPLLAACRERGLLCWNLAEAFEAQGVDSPIEAWFSRGGHYSPEGNAIVASWIEQQLHTLR